MNYYKYSQVIIAFVVAIGAFSGCSKDPMETMADNYCNCINDSDKRGYETANACFELLNDCEKYPVFTFFNGDPDSCSCPESYDKSIDYYLEQYEVFLDYREEKCGF